MLSYLDTKKEEIPKENTVENNVEDISDGFIGWTFSTPTSSTPLKSSVSWSSPYSSRRN
jgi:hypothetical protein